jgi:GNAT superfamily N-acetyltransferase
VVVLQRLEVIEAARASGVGRELLDAFVAFARSKGPPSDVALDRRGPTRRAGSIRPPAASARRGTYWWVFE